MKALHGVVLSGLTERFVRSVCPIINAVRQATEQEKRAWTEANLKGLERMQHSIEFMLHDLAQYDETQKIARQSRLMSIFNQLTEDGQEKALDFLEIMLGNPKYKK